MPKKKTLGAMPQVRGNISVPEMPEAAICSRHTLREMPSFSVPKLRCPSPYFDWSPVAIVGAHLRDPQAILPDTSELAELEVLLLHELGGWEAPPAEHHDALLAAFSGSNHFIVYSKDPIGQEDAYNRLVAMASAEVVAVVQPGEEAALTTAMIRNAAAKFGRHERLGAVGYGVGWSDGKLVLPEGDQAGWALVDAVVSGPVFVRRRAFLEAGSLWAQCEDLCLDSSMVDLSVRLWESGYSVGVASAHEELLEGGSNRRKLNFMRGKKEESREAPDEDEDQAAGRPEGKEIAADAQRLRLTLARARAHVHAMKQIYNELLEPLPRPHLRQGDDLTNEKAAADEKKQRASSANLHGVEMGATDKPTGASWKIPNLWKGTTVRHRTVPGADRPPPVATNKEQKAKQPPESLPQPPQQPPPQPQPLVQEKLSELVQVPAKSLADRPCAVSVTRRLRALEDSAALKAVGEKRKAVLEDLSYDTVQAKGKGFGNRRYNQALMDKGWGDKRLKAPSAAIAVCAGVSPEAITQHRCAPPRPAAGMIMQFFNRAKNIPELSLGISSTTQGIDTELIINDDSRSDVDIWLSELRDSGYEGQVFISLSPNVHEIRGYNRLSKFSRARYLVHMQDDDVPRKQGWLEKALILFNNLPKLALLGGLRGRMDFGTIMDTRYNYINGPKYGPASDKRGCCKKIVHWEPQSRIPFMYMYKVNLSPVILQRDRFLQMGMYHPHFSCPGDPGIGLDFELSIRAWRLGFRTGLYPADFKLHIGQSRVSGTRSNEKMFQRRRANELRNNKMMYTMYKGFHHKEGNYKAAQALRSLPAPKNWEAMNDAGGTRDFLKLHRGWYISNKVAANSQARADFQRMFAELMLKGKGT